MKKSLERYRGRYLAPLALTLVLVFTSGLASQRVNAQLDASPGSLSAEAAVGFAVQGLSLPYAGPCSTTTSPDDLGKTCSKFVAQQGSVNAYLVGRTFAEFDEWVFVEQVPAGWSLVTTAPLDGAATTVVVPWPSS